MQMKSSQSLPRIKGCRNGTLRLATCAALLFMAACSVGPDYKRPVFETPGAYKEADPSKSSQSLEDVESRNWWKIFADPGLNTLEQLVEIS
jgi:uncharacterized lipoprotein